jgi:hypothetical protein
MSGTRALVEASLSAIELGREGGDKLVDILTQLIDEEVAQIVHESLEGREPPTRRKEDESGPSSPGANHRARPRPGGRKPVG